MVRADLENAEEEGISSTPERRTLRKKWREDEKLTSKALSKHSSSFTRLDSRRDGLRTNDETQKW